MTIEQNQPPPEVLDPSQRRQFYRAALERRVAAGLAQGVKVPKLEGLRERRIDQPFHATPEIFLQERGCLEFTFPRSRFTLEEGEVALIPRGVPHGEEWVGEGYANMIVMFRPNGVVFTRGYLLRQRRIAPPDFCPYSLRPEEYCDEIAAALHEGGDPRGPLVRGLMLALMGRLLEALDRPLPPTHTHPLVRQCRAMIEAHFAQPDFSVQWMARALACTPDHLSRTFRRYSGQRLMLAIHQRRVEHAKQLLADPTFQIAEVAWACGFTTPSYFNRVFRSATGATPGEYRARRV